jgi:hypothetical protein
MAPHQKKSYLTKGILQLTNIVFTALSITQKSPNHGKSKSYGSLTTHDEVEHGLCLPTVTKITQINYHLSILYRNLHRKDLPKVAFQTMKAILGILQGNKILDFSPKPDRRIKHYTVCLNNLQDILPPSTTRSSLSAASLSKSTDSLGFIKNNIIMRPI